MTCRDCKQQIIACMELLETSSSDSDTDLDEYLFLALEAFQKKNNAKEMVKEKEEKVPSNNSIENIYLEKISVLESDQDFSDKFCVKKNVFEYLAKDYSKSRFMRANNSNVSIHNTAQYDMLIFLYYMGMKQYHLDIVSEFNIDELVLLKIIDRVSFFLSQLARKEIRFPATAKEKLKVSQYFQQISGIPGVLGSLGCSFVYINSNRENESKKPSRNKCSKAIVIQGVSGINGSFSYIHVMTTSTKNESKIYEMSPLSSLLTGIEPTYHVVANENYQLKEWLLTPIHDDEIKSVKDTLFNERISFVQAESASSFTSLRKRFPRLRRKNFMCEEKMIKLIVSCCVIHNICVRMDESSSKTEHQHSFEGSAEDLSGDADYNDELHEIGEQKRLKISEFLVSH